MRFTMIGLLAITLILGVHVQTKAQHQAQSNQPAENALNDLARQGFNVIQPQLVGQPAIWNVNYTMDLSNLSTDMSLVPAGDALRAHLSLPKDQGLIVTALAANASAALAGVRQDDVLLKLDETALAKSEDLEEGLKAAGDKPASLTILRAGKKLKVQVQPHVRVTMGPVQAAPPAFWIGISVSPLEPALRSQLKLPQNQGLLAIDIIKDSPAAKAEVKVHDILLSLAGKPLESQEKLVELVQASGEKSVQVELIREGKTQTIDVTPERRKPDQVQAAVQGVRNLDNIYYQLVRPGALVTVDQNGAVATIDEKGGWIADVSPKNPGSSAGRLDEIETQIKQLRKAIEELNKTLKDKK